MEGESIGCFKSQFEKIMTFHFVKAGRQIVSCKIIICSIKDWILCNLCTPQLIYRKIPKISPSKYKPPKPVMQKPSVKSPLQI